MIINPEDIIYNQENDYSCGAVCLRWIYDILRCHKEFSQLDMEKITKTSYQGTSHKGIKEACKELGLFYDEFNELDIISRCLKSGDSKAIVGWTPWDEHYSVVVDITDDFIVLNDPASPSCISVYAREEFEKVWFDSENGQRKEHWAIVIC